ncbi:MAG: methyltransferase domain-containing protein, partial [Pseudonocardiaceae bacterium]
MTATVAYRHDLAGALVSGSVVRSQWLRRAFEDTPREVFVPRFYRRSESGHKVLVEGTDPAQHEQWLRGVYSDEALTVQVTPAPDLVDPAGAPTSSSSMPTVMAGMLEALDLQPGHRVLEIGTGTGYNAALLCQRVGAHHVASVELDPALADAARRALAELGLHPRVHTGDGAAGLAAAAPFDRIIATASTDHIPPAWISQLAPGGAIVVDVRGSLAGSLLRLTRTERDLVEGAFLNLPGAFMPMRTRLDSPHRDGESWEQVLDQRNPHQATTPVNPALVAQNRSLQFMTQLHLAGRRLRGFVLDGTEISGHGTDGSWFTAGLGPDNDGLYPVAQGGPQRLWDTVESSYFCWRRLGEPGVEQFGVTALDDAELQYVWCDHPDSQHR